MFKPFKILEKSSLLFKINLPSFWAIFYIFLISLVSVYSINAMHDAYHKVVDKDMQRALISEKISHLMLQLHRVRAELILETTNQTTFEDIAHEISQMQHLFEQLDSLKDHNSAYKIDHAHEAFKEFRVYLLKSLDFRDFHERLIYLKKNHIKIKNTVDTMLNSFIQMNDQNLNSLEKEAKEVHQLYHKILWGFLGLFVFVLVVYTTYITFIRKLIDIKLNQIRKKITIIEHGNFLEEEEEEEEEEEDKKSKSELHQISLTLSHVIRLLREDVQEIKERNWLQRTIIEFSTILHIQNNLENMLKTLVDSICHKTQALHAVFYFYDAKAQMLILKSDYASSLAQKSIKLGEGLIGQVALDRKEKHIKHTQKHLADVGASQIQLNHTYIYPFRDGEKLLGILEFSTIEEISKIQKMYIKEIEESICKSAFKIIEKTNRQQLLEKIQRQAQELQKTSEYKSTFLATMSHELRTPLNAINTLSSLMLKNKNEALDIKNLEKIKAINTAGADLLELINDILDLSKIEAKKVELNLHWLDIDSVGIKMYEMFKNQFETKNIDFSLVNNLEKKMMINSDQQKLEQILKNFLSNALKFTPASGKVSLELHPINDAHYKVALHVKDSGIGIAQENLEHIFEAFSQEDSSISRKFGGTGLGLSICKELSKLLHAKIEISSRKTLGSTFSLLIPNSIKQTDLPSSHVGIGKEKKHLLHVMLIGDETRRIFKLIQALDEKYVDASYVHEFSEIEDSFDGPIYNISQLSDEEILKMVNEKIKEKKDV